MEKQQYTESQEYEVLVNLKRNVRVSILDGAVYTLGMGMIPIGTLLVYYIENFTDSKVLIGLFTTLYNLMFFTPQILMAKKVQALKYYMPLSVTLALAQRIIWLLIGVATFLLARSNPALYLLVFYILIALVGMVSGFTNNIWLVLIARVIPDNKLSNFLSVRSSICGVFEVLGAYLSGIILSCGTFPNNYGVLFIISFALTMVSFVLYLLMREPKNVTKKPVQMDNRHYFKNLGGILKKDKNFLVYLLSTALVGGLGKMSLTFQVVYAREKLSINDRQVALVSIVLFITQTCGYILWGFVVKKKGLKMAGLLSGFLFIPSILLTLWMPNMTVLLIAVLFMSLGQSYRNSNENKLVINLAPNETSLPSYIGLKNTIMGPFFSLNSLFAGFILDTTNFTVLSIVSLVLMTVGVLLFKRLYVPEK